MIGISHRNQILSTKWLRLLLPARTCTGHANNFRCQTIAFIPDKETGSRLLKGGGMHY